MSVSMPGKWIYEEHGYSVPYWVETAGGSNWLHMHLPDTLNPSCYTPDSVYFDIYAGELTPGVYVDSIIIFNPLDDDTLQYNDVCVPVSITVEGEPTDYIVQTMPTSFDFTLYPGEFTFDSLNVYEQFGRSVSFVFSNNQPWLSVDAPYPWPPSTTPTLLTLLVGDSLLEPGTYVDTITIESATGKDTILFPTVIVPVNLVVEDYSDCGDVDGSGVIEISDVVYIVNYIFKSGGAPRDLYGGDVNCDEIPDVSDAVYLTSYIFLGGPEPCANCP